VERRELAERFKARRFASPDNLKWALSAKIPYPIFTRLHCGYIDGAQGVPPHPISPPSAGAYTLTRLNPKPRSGHTRMLSRIGTSTSNRLAQLTL
jgi:hypothetical protein